jgi:hypothetical protein
MRGPLFLLVVLLVSSPVSAQPPAREQSLVVYGDDPCPEVEGEVVVCARRPEEERYRIPRPIRERQPTEVAWGSRVEALEEESRHMRPDSCSTVGSGGFTGCTAAMIRQWYAERRARRAAEASVP